MRHAPTEQKYVVSGVRLASGVAIQYRRHIGPVSWATANQIADEMEAHEYEDVTIDELTRASDWNIEDHRTLAQRLASAE